MSDTSEHHASCFCGSVQFTLSGEPEAMAYCHCDSCRQWSAGPVSAFTLWKPSALHVTQGSELVSVFEKNPGSDDHAVVSRRQWCKVCGGHVFTEHPTMGVTDVPAVVIKRFDFTPGFHVHYQETIHPMTDGLTKFKDLPKEAGGSGEELPS